MNNSGSSLNEKLQNATELLTAGQKKEARQLLREILHIDRKNLKAWELLQQAVYNVEEEAICLKNILAIDPNHASAKRRYAKIRSSMTGTTTGGERSDQNSMGIFNPNRTSNTSPLRPSSRKKKRQATTLLLLLGLFIFFMCISITGFALYRSGYVVFPSNLTATALAERNASCQTVINKAIQASDNYCGGTNSNKVCYGNTTIKAELAPGATERFSERGDIISVNELRRLSAAPLNPGNNEWGIAVFKVIANLPRSLPGETITMVVFGNTALDNNSGNLESFYFSSELGQITCEKVPFDGLMITSPGGSGVRFNVNGAELTIMGDASLKAYKNGQMEVSLYKGSGRIVSNGQEQYFGAGQKVSVDLGGENGTQAISAPSKPKPLSQDEFNTACTMTGHYCTQSAITPVSEDQAQGQFQTQITFTPTSLTSAPTRIPSATDIPTNTAFVLPSWTPTKGTPTSTKRPSRTPTKTVTPNRTLTLTNAPSPTQTTPTVTIVSVSLNPTNAGTTVTWHANENGTYSVLVGSTSCTNGTGTIADNGIYTTSPANFASVLVPTVLASGSNNLRVCVTNTAANTGSATSTVTKDVTGPTVTINQAGTQADPTNSSSINFTVVFSESVTSFTNTDVTLGGAAGATTATVTGSGTTYNVAVSGMTGNGAVTATVNALAVTDALGNNSSASTSTDNTVTYDTTGPTVTINQAVGQADPTNASPINFTVVFSEATTTFATGDVTLNGTAGATTATVTGSGTNYNVVVSGMTGNGTVIASIGAGVATDALGNNNTASTSTDNTVTYNITGGPTDPLCSSVSLTNLTNDATSLKVVITNNSGATITITRFYSNWVNLPSSQKITALQLNGIVIFNPSSPNPPSDIPGSSLSGATIPNTAAYTFEVIFSSQPPQSPGNLSVVFDTSTPCQVTGSW